MGLLYNVKRFLSIKADGVIKANQKNIEVLAYELEKSKLQIDSLGDKISSLRADRQVTANDIERTEAKRNQLQGVLDTAVEKNDGELGNEAISLLDKNTARLEILTKNLEYFDGVIGKLEEQYDSLHSQLEAKTLIFDKLKMQSEFAENMKSINEEIKKNYSGSDFDFSGIEAIEKEIEKSVYYETDRNQHIGAAASIEAKLEKATAVNKFEEYKRQLAEKQGE